MGDDRLTTDPICGFARRTAGGAIRQAPIELKPLRGGPEAQDIALITVRHRDARMTPHLGEFHGATAGSTDLVPYLDLEVE
jgi:hypothetical protein